MRPISAVAATLQIPPDDLVVFGEHMAKLRLRAMPDRDVAPDGRLILVSAIHPTRDCPRRELRVNQAVLTRAGHWLAWQTLPSFRSSRCHAQPSNKRPS
jgi:hypothetical protein